MNRHGNAFPQQANTKKEIEVKRINPSQIKRHNQQIVQTMCQTSSKIGKCNQVPTSMTVRRHILTANISSLINKTAVKHIQSPPDAMQSRIE
jgi:hypothetical protein